MASQYKGAVQCSLPILCETVSQWSRNVSKDMSWACFWKLIMYRCGFECPVGDCSRRPDQPHELPGCSVVDLSGVQTTGSATNRKVRNSWNWDAQFVWDNMVVPLGSCCLSEVPSVGLETRWCQLWSRQAWWFRRTVAPWCRRLPLTPPHIRTSTNAWRPACDKSRGSSLARRVNDSATSPATILVVHSTAEQGRQLSYENLRFTVYLLLFAYYEHRKHTR